jgi:hypothetical protein
VSEIECGCVCKEGVDRFNREIVREGHRVRYPKRLAGVGHVSRGRRSRATHLYSLLLEVDLEGELLAQKDVRVVGLVEGRLELLELLLREYRPVSALALGHGPDPGGPARAQLVRVGPVVEGRLPVEGDTRGRHRSHVAAGVEARVSRSCKSSRRITKLVARTRRDKMSAPFGTL